MAFPTIPTIADGRILATYQANTTATRTFPDLGNLTAAAGDLLIAIVFAYQTGTGTDAAFSDWTGGFTEFHDSATSTTMAIGCAYKWSTGSETGTFAVTQAATVTGHAAMIVMAIPGAHASTPPEAGGRNSGTTTAANAGPFNPTEWDVEDVLWVAVAGCGEISTSGAWTGIASAPTNYTGYFETGLGGQDVAGAVEGAVAFRQLASASEDAGTFSLDANAARSGALVIAVRPAPVLIQVGTAAPEGAPTGVQEVAHPTTSEEAGTGAAPVAAFGVQGVDRERTGSAAADGVGTGTETVQAGITESVVSIDLVGLTITYAPTVPSIYKVRAGCSAAAGVGVGTETVTHPATSEKAGAAAAPAAALGAETVAHPTVVEKAGLGAVAGAAAGAQAVQSPGAIVKTGTGAAAGAPGGVELVQQAGAVVKAGMGAAGLAAAGAETVAHSATATKAGAGVASGAAAGTRTLDHGKASAGAAAAVGAGQKTVQTATTYAKTGVGVAAGAGLGPETVTHPATVTKAATAAAAGAPGGVELVQAAGAIVKVGTGAAAVAAAGVRSTVFVRVGTGAAAGTPAGGKVRELAAKPGLGATAAAGLGGKVRELATKPGLAAAAAVALGGEVRELQRTSLAAVAGVGTGARNRDSYRTGCAVAELTAGGTHPPLPSSLTQGVAIPGYATTATAVGGNVTALQPIAVSGDATNYYVTTGI